MFRIVLTALALLAAPLLVSAGEGKIVKVLPHLLDHQGRHSLSPSLYERDAYQAELRKHPDKVGGLRYDVHWKAARSGATDLKLRLQLRTANRAATDPLVVDAPVKTRSKFAGWASVTLDGDAFRKAGDVLSWRATLLDGDKEIAESKSFLW